MSDAGLRFAVSITEHRTCPQLAVPRLIARLVLVPGHVGVPGDGDAWLHIVTLTGYGGRTCISSINAWGEEGQL